MLWIVETAGMRNRHVRKHRHRNAAEVARHVSMPVLTKIPHRRSHRTINKIRSRKSSSKFAPAAEPLSKSLREPSTGRPRLSSIRFLMAISKFPTSATKLMQRTVAGASTTTCSGARIAFRPFKILPADSTVARSPLALISICLARALSPQGQQAALRSCPMIAVHVPVNRRHRWHLLTPSSLTPGCSRRGSLRVHRTPRLMRSPSASGKSATLRVKRILRQRLKSETDRRTSEIHPWTDPSATSAEVLSRQFWERVLTKTQAFSARVPKSRDIHKDKSRIP